MPEKKPQEKESELWENIIAITIVVVLVGGAWFGITHLGENEETPEQRYPITINDDPLLGDINAPITIIEFSDFECTHCATFALETFPQLKEKYIDTGIARFVFRDFPIETIHPNAQFVHEAAGCAHDQDMFWEYHDELFKRQSELSPTVLGDIADEVGLNRVEFDECREKRKYLDEINADILMAKQQGQVSGTPTFFINGLKITGAQPISAFDEIIAQELEEK